MLWLGLHLPRLPLEVYTRGCAGSDPIAVFQGHGTAQTVLLADEAAQRLGISAGMSLGAAYALSTRLRARPRDTAREVAALEGLAAWSGQFTPLVCLDPPQALLLEVQGSLRLFAGLGALRDRLCRGVSELGYSLHLATAPTPLGAALLARAGVERCIQSPAALRQAFGSLPLEVLNLSAKQQTTLEGMGVRQLQDCLRLPRDGIARRLGPALLDLLDRALGRAPDPRAPFMPPTRFRHSLTLPAGVSETEALLFAVHRLLHELAGMLRSRNSGVQRLDLDLAYGDGRHTTLVLGLAAPTRDLQRMLLVSRDRFARLQLRAPVHEITLTADDVLVLPEKNLELLPDASRSGDPAVLLERLRARLGPEAVRGLRVVAEHRPELAWGYCEPGEAHFTAQDPSRPLWLLERPRPLRLVNGRPQFDGALNLEPMRERIESGWWDDNEVLRDYFIARNPKGLRLWIFRELTGARRWFLHGFYG
jgi:protein ImuB